MTKFRFKCRYVAVDSSGYYYPRWDRSTPITVVAGSKAEAMKLIWQAAGESPRGRHWEAVVDEVKQVEDEPSN